MAASVSVFLCFFLGLVLVGLVSSAKFDQLFQPSWANDHFVYEGELLKLKLDHYSGKNDRFLKDSKLLNDFCVNNLLGLCFILLNLSFRIGLSSL